ncbi:MAG: oligosaccharide flippase family protein [Candidatus Bathyarchaeota archaeon]|nr:MAG: oligosaccharide flippase family protein [Candidatus Bathyarchaeota archaeon]
MDKALKMGQVSVSGSFRLFLGKVLSSILLAIGSIILGRVMSPSEYGIYAIALIPSMTLALFRDWGITKSTTKNISQYRSEHKNENIYNIILVGLLFKTVISSVLSLGSLFLASNIATLFFNRPEISSLISIASLVILFESFIGISQSVFSGYEKMEYISYNLVCHALIRSIVGPFLVLLGYGAMGAIIGYTFSFIITAILGITLLYIKILKNLKKPKLNFQEKIKTLKEMLSYGFPISISEILGSFLYQFYAFLMAFYVNNVLIGNYQIAVNFTVFISFFSYPLVTVLFPAFSKLNPKQEIQLLRSVFSSAVKYAAIFLVPATMATIVLSIPVIETVYGQQWVHAPFFLSLYVLQNFFVLIGGLVIDSFLQGIGETKILLKLSILRLGFGIILSIILIPIFDIVGVILGTFLAEGLNKILAAYWLKKTYDAKPEYMSSFKIFISATIVALVTHFVLDNLIVASWLKLIIGAGIFLFLYIVLLPVTGAITLSDIKNLKSIFSNLGIFSKIINIPLTFAKIIASFIHR